MSSSLQIRIDTQLKTTVEHILAEMGLDTSTAVRMFFAKIAKTKSLPFRVDLSAAPEITENGFTKEEEEEILIIAREEDSYGLFSPEDALTFLDACVKVPRASYKRAHTDVKKKVHIKNARNED